MYKIIETDNFGGDYPDERAICMLSSDNDYNTLVFPHIDKAQIVCDALNTSAHPHYFRIKPIDYILRGGFIP